MIVGESLREGRGKKESQQLGRTRHRDLAGGTGSAGRSENAWRLAFLCIRLLLVCCNAGTYSRATGTPNVHLGGNFRSGSIMALCIAVNKDNVGEGSEGGRLGNNPHPNLSLQGILFSHLRVVLQCDVSTLLGCFCGDRNTDMRQKNTINRVQTRSHRGRWSAHEYVTSHAGYCRAS